MPIILYSFSCGSIVVSVQEGHGEFLLVIDDASVNEMRAIRYGSASAAHAAWLKIVTVCVRDEHGVSYIPTVDTLPA